MTLAAPDLASELGRAFPCLLEIGRDIHGPMYANRVPAVKRVVRGFGNAMAFEARYPCYMSKKQPKPHHFLREWRQFRGMTLEDLADVVGTTKGVISELELSKKGLSLKWLYRLAPALQTSPGSIVDFHPAEIDHEALSAFLRISDSDKSQVLQVIKVLQKKAS